MLAELMANPEREFSLTDLATQAGVSVPTILRDIDRLVVGGYVRDRRVGRTRLVSINRDHPIFEPLRQIVMYGYGPAVVLREALADVPRIEKAFIYGSWAARYLGEPGADPNDIDVLVIGNPDSGELYAAARQASEKVRREVNINAITPKRWSKGEDGFVETVRSHPLLQLELESR